ncbi:hypothetical protein GGTG_01363 [Gaeumannomyces tritici R3-111a-1]|uniref:Uncharacterized protein n=1 Tax=Gaeumannomyces tritici (strain R3-111a-1) TaxID=644352 RepID=J3NJD1_GAET3|nr:hypothetical protein GGTG_01363 [Gaeumannomyces tritici R3-111a-1]EJT81382.1 hypothetical protein GGTG_01363 [Gaeumannomyces tritici R3-111a-1]
MASKTVSSRLLTMKFMQRGIAASSANSSLTTPRSEDKHGSKRRKVSQDTTDCSSSGPKIDGAAVQAALDEEERKRRAAIAKQAEDLGDTRWVLDFPAPSPRSSDRMPQTPLNIVQIGFAQIDSADSAATGGQMRRFNMKKASKAQEEDAETGSESDDSGSSDEEPRHSKPKSSAGSPESRGRQLSNDSSKRKRTKSETSGRMSTERAKAQQLSAKRRKKDVKLNMPKSISSAGSFKAPSRPGREHR